MYNMCVSLSRRFANKTAKLLFEHYRWQEKEPLAFHGFHVFTLSFPRPYKAIWHFHGPIFFPRSNGQMTFARFFSEQMAPHAREVLGKTVREKSCRRVL